MATLDTAIEPELSTFESDELSHLEYFRQRLEELRARDLIAAGACETVLAEGRARRETILRHGQYRATVGRREAVGCKQAPGRGL